MRHAAIIVLASVAVVFVAGGCSGKKAETPAEAMADLRLALANNDEGAFLDCFEADKECTQALIAMFGSLAETDRYEKALGKDAGDSKTISAAARAGAWLEGATLTSDENSASCALKDGKTRIEITFVEDKGAWLIKPRSLLAAMSEEVIAPQVLSLAGGDK